MAALGPGSELYETNLQQVFKQTNLLNMLNAQNREQVLVQEKKVSDVG